MKTNEELIKIWKDVERTRRENHEAEIKFEMLEGEDKLKIFDLIKEGVFVK